LFLTFFSQYRRFRKAVAKLIFFLYQQGYYQFNFDVIKANMLVENENQKLTFT
jgi:hypothetical protein